ncbi:SPOR domain-containing protein [Haliea sp. E17]|uniref:SPOR domain-containing protein n=1 Tax=Haliea sp. E17 TaxID=3401576 RepID=UPI003AB098F1
MKQRLVGALILVALGVVFWPIIFVEPNAPVATDGRTVPPRPQLDTSPLPAPDDSALRELPAPQAEAPVPEDELVDLQPESGAGAGSEPSAGQGDDSAGGAADVTAPEPAPTVAAAPPEAGETRGSAPVKPELDAEGIPIAWVLQVASVSEAERADALRSELLAMGHKAYIKKIRSGGKTWYRVSVGPKVEKARLEAARSEIDAKFGVTSLVVRYYP